MNRPFVSVFLIGGLLITGAPVAARAGGNMLSLDDAVRQALENNPEIRQAAASREEARVSAREKSSERLPKITQVDQYTRSDDASTQLPDSNQVTLQAEESLFRAGRWTDLERLRQVEKGSAAELAQKKNEIVLAVRESYFRVISASETLVVWDEAQKELSGVLRFVEPKFTVGTVPEYDYAKIRVTISQYRQNHLDTDRALSHELFTLGERMASDPPSGVQPLPDVAEPPSLDLPAIVERTYTTRPDLQAATADAEAERFGVQSAWREYWPTATLTGDYGYTGDTWNDMSLGWGYGGLLSLPIFDFGGIHSRIRQADARHRVQLLQRDALKLKIRTDINDQVQAVRAAWEKLRLIRESVPEARKGYESSVHRYRTSLAPFTELSDAHDLWVDVRIQQVQAVLEYRVALAELVAAQGLLEAPR